MAEFKINKGLDIPLQGEPARDVAHVEMPEFAAVYPSEYPEVKARMEVEVGQSVKRGSTLFSCKKREDLSFCSPVAGVIKAIELGERRAVTKILIETDPANEAVEFNKYNLEQTATLVRGEVINLLQQTGFMAFIRQRPFSRIANPASKPKSIFINAMQQGPFRSDAEVVIGADPAAFQAGLNLMMRLTDGKVYLNIASNATFAALIEPRGVEINTFAGPHPAGNNSVHIAKLDPISPGETVWTVDAANLVLIGKLFLEGVLPERQIVSLAGPGVKPEHRRHYNAVRGGELKPLIRDALAEGEQRIISGNILIGDKVSADDCLRFFAPGLTVISEERKREFIGWMAPGLNVFSTSRLFLSKWLRPNAKWSLTTADHGGKRAMFATGIYDRVMPLNIMVDFLLRAIIGHDTEEAVSLGILETDPEDFALCSYMCPSRTDIVGIIRDGLQEIEDEGVYTQELD